MEEAENKVMLREIKRRTNDVKEDRAKWDALVNIADSLRWLKYGNVLRRDEALYCYLQDRKKLFGPEDKCLDCHEKRKTVDQLATQCESMLEYDYM